MGITIHVDTKKLNFNKTKAKIMQFNLKMLQRQKRAKRIQYKRIIQPLWCLKEFKTSLHYSFRKKMILYCHR